MAKHHKSTSRAVSAAAGTAPAPHRSFRTATEPGRWQDVGILEYKEEGAAPFKSITRQTLFSDPALAGELRYFEMKPGGYSTL